MIYIAIAFVLVEVTLVFMILERRAQHNDIKEWVQIIAMQPESSNDRGCLDEVRDWKQKWEATNSDYILASRRK